METAEHPDINEPVDVIELADRVVDAFRNDKLYKVKDFPREAFEVAAALGIAVYEMDKKFGIDDRQIAMSFMEKHARLGLLKDEAERERAERLARDWLEDGFDR